MLQTNQLCESTTTIRSAGNKCSSNGNTRVALSMAHRKWAGQKKRESSIIALLLLRGKPAFLVLDPQAKMGAVWSYTSSLSRLFTTKKIDRITVKFLWFSGKLGHGGKLKFFVQHSVSLHIDHCIIKKWPFICCWLFRQEDWFSQMIELWEIPTSVLFLCWNNTYLQAKCAEMLTCENN